MEEKSTRKVFIVEDNAFYASLMKNELEKFCGNISVFSTGEKCIENISLKPDVVLLDQHLSGTLTGLDVLKKIKEYNKQIEVIFVSGSFQVEVVKDALKNGATDYINKGDSTFDLVEKKLTDIFQFNAKALELKINNSAKKISLIMFLLMMTFLFFLFVNY
jgi:DNA-binding NtrC family response regulator